LAIVKRLAYFHIVHSFRLYYSNYTTKVDMRQWQKRRNKHIIDSVYISRSYHKKQLHGSFLC